MIKLCSDCLARIEAEKERVRAARRKRQSSDAYRRWRREYRRRKKLENPEYRLTQILRRRLHHALQGRAKAATTFELLGCTAAELKEHLERQFVDGMSWDNCGSEVHIDHIRPCASFDLSDPEEQKKCFHYTNLQPLWAEDNMKKSDKWDAGPEEK